MPKMAQLLRADRLVCCCTLQSGLLMFAFFMAGTFASSSMSVFYEDSDHITKEDDLVSEDKDFEHHDAKKEEVIRKIIKKFMASEVIAGIAGAIGVNVLLIIGVIYKKPGLLMPWLVLSAVGLCLFALVLVISPFMLAFILPPMPAFSAIVFIIMLLYFAFGVYFFFVVFTYVQEVTNEFGSEENLCQAPSPKVSNMGRAPDPEEPPPRYEDLELNYYPALPPHV